MIEDQSEMPYPDAVYIAYFKLKFISYVAYLLISVYYSSYLEEMKKQVQHEEEFTESHWKRLFEYSDTYEN